ncbi:XRE family transcriptional regulator [Streptomyces sp. NBC_01264]|uniref:XRE family transcriptional regulator n=1 Tax=Streptomyces sp. NBC_01264 TaxID=2903804 RepID=UPI002251C7DC|nr:XRE family transcriptional regulator [Streptomyces sp. NBC_01264]MCX4784020.1 XRE family transcriptional regulator [Streptomyces sp. NBC_01264]
MAAVVQWTGREAALLGQAMRLPIRVYAEQLGVNPKTVTKWRKHGRSIKLRPETADMLDAMKLRCTPDVLETFHASLAEEGDDPAVGVQSAEPDPEGTPALGPATVVSHKFIPVYVGEAVQAITGTPRGPGPGGLEHRSTPAAHPDASADSQLHLYDCGVVIAHLVQPLHVQSLGELAAWRYRTYAADLRWADSRIRELLSAQAQTRTPAPTYVLSAYLLEDSPWQGTDLESALQLLTTPSVLVDRQDPEAAVRLGDDVERKLLVEGFEHADVIDFGSRAVALGLAGWSGVAYHPIAPERALPMSSVVALELDVQTLWALSTYVLDEVEAGRDPVMPKDYGWRFLRGAYSRLTAARAQETAQHQLMREAILTTSQLPDRLRAAQEALRESGI